MYTTPPWLFVQMNISKVKYSSVVISDLTFCYKKLIQYKFIQILLNKLLPSRSEIDNNEALFCVSSFGKGNTETQFQIRQFCLFRGSKTLLFMKILLQLLTALYIISKYLGKGYSLKCTQFLGTYWY